MCHFWVRRGLKMILSHMAPSCFNMSSYRAIWILFRRNSIIFEQIQFPKFISLNFQISAGPLGRHFFESCAPRKMMQNSIDGIFWGRTFKNTSYLNLRFTTRLTIRFTIRFTIGTRILVTKLFGELVLGDGGTAPLNGTNRYPF